MWKRVQYVDQKNWMAGFGCPNLTYKARVNSQLIIINKLKRETFLHLVTELKGMCWIKTGEGTLMSKQGPHLGAGGWFISRTYRHSPSESNNVIIAGLRHHTPTRHWEDCSPLVCPDVACGRSYGGVFAWVRGLLLLLYKVKWPFHSGLPALGFALGLGQLHHKEGKHNHGTKKRKHRDGLAHLLIIAARHYSWGNTQTWIIALCCLNVKCPFVGDIWLIISWTQS